MSISFISYLLAFLTLFSHLLLVAGFIYYLLFKEINNNFLIKILSRNGLLLAFFISLIATLGSLFYSEIAGFDPCRLCWYQRIFMYPQVILLGVAYLRKDFKIIPYSVYLSLVGMGIALYHNYIYYIRTSSSFCGVADDCIKRYIFEFGYITIPIMAVTAFFLIIVLLALQVIHNNSSK